MNHYTMDTLTVGTTESFTVELTEDKMHQFTDISGDVNPIHVDADYAKRQGFPDVLGYGLQTASLYSALIGVHLPGWLGMCQEMELQFKNPVFIGDTLEVEGKVVEVHTVFRRVKIKAMIRNQHGKVVSKAMLFAGVREEK